MKKAILITGRQGSGKTTKLKEILSKYDKVLLLSYLGFSLYWTKEVEHVQAFGIEEIQDAKQLEEILQVSAQVNCQIIATCQTGIFELTETLLSNFKVINCNV
jgi:nucleoside-triphosphatase THEP1